MYLHYFFLVLYFLIQQFCFILHIWRTHGFYPFIPFLVNKDNSLEINNKKLHENPVPIYDL